MKDAKSLERIGEVGAWLTATPNLSKGTTLPANELCVNTLIFYGMHPHNMQDQCNGCDTDFSVDHGIKYKEQGLTFGCHTNLVGTTGAIAAMARPSHASCTNSKILYSMDVLAGQDIVDLEKTGHELQCYMTVHGLWKRGNTCLDIVVTDKDTTSYKHVSLRTAIEGATQKKKKKYLDTCLKRCKTFMSLL